MIRLPMTDHAQICDVSRLEQIELPLTEDDIDYYNRVGWKWYHPDHFIKTLTPSLGERRSYHSLKDVVLPIFDNHYQVKWEEDYNYPPYELTGKYLVLIPTTQPVTEPDGNKYSWYQFFGQPRWVQGEHHVVDLLGNPCYHFLTIENHWGDMGNFNILLGFDENKIPNLAYFEASCC